MYIKKVKIKRVRSIDSFEMNFSKPAGWHVLIGDNGAGKSTIIRSIALALIGFEEIGGIKPNWSDWLQWKAPKGGVEVVVRKDKHDEFPPNSPQISSETFEFLASWQRDPLNIVFYEGQVLAAKEHLPSESWRGRTGWFAAGFGPFRRFTGGSTDKESIFTNPSFSRLASHLSLFGEDVALTEATKWLMNLKFQSLENKISNNLLDNLKTLINSPDFLPHGSLLKDISSDGVIFVDGNGAEISVTQMSDGYRSILSLTFELLRQLIKVYGDEKVFSKIQKGKMEIDLPGVVLIDEVDVHLHPTWQTRIGQWFTKFFPKIQFIVTTHSPLICRASINGTIWRLAAPGSENVSGEITGTDKNRLIYGNILDAYGTEVFGETITIPEQTTAKLNRLTELNQKSMMGDTSPVEENELYELKSFITPIMKPNA